MRKLADNERRITMLMTDDIHAMMCSAADTHDVGICNLMQVVGLGLLEKGIDLQSLVEAGLKKHQERGGMTKTDAVNARMREITDKRLAKQKLVREIADLPQENLAAVYSDIVSKGGMDPRN